MEQAIRQLSLLDKDGNLAGTPPEAFLDPERLRHAYRTMTLIRQFDRKAIALQRTGKLGTYSSTLGQEAIGVAIGLCMREEDVFVPYYRDYPAQYLRGVKLSELLAYWGGDERGSDFSAGGHDLPISVPVATQASHGAGVAAAFKFRQEPRVALTTCGDGATSKGDFLESINLAGVWHLPVVYVVNNNRYAISVPRSLQSAAPTLAHKALGAGIQGVQVDGNDVIALQVEIDKALTRARSNKGATLIEAVTYRLSDHTTADDATRYRDEEEVKKAWEEEPIARLRAYLLAQGLWGENKEKELLESCDASVNQAVEEYLSAPPQAPEDMFDYHYAELPASLREQRQHVGRKAKRRGDQGNG